MAPVTPSPATEPRRSTRLRSKLADADPDAEHERGASRGKRRRKSANTDADAELERGASRGKRQTKSADAELERGASRGKRRRKSAGKAAGGTRGSAAKETNLPVGAEAPGMTEAEYDAGGAISGDMCAEEPGSEKDAAAALEEETLPSAQRKKKRVARPSAQRRADAAASQDRFVGDPIPDGEARQRWPARYTSKDDSDGEARQRWPAKYTNKDSSDSRVTRSSDDGEEEIGALCHYSSACVDDSKYDLGDDVYIQAGPDEETYIGRIIEFFEGIDRGSYFTCRWFYRVADTVISPKLLKDHDRKRVFLSEEKNDNMIESIITKVNIIYVSPNIPLQAKAELISKSDLYYDMSYSVACSTFAKLPAENGGATGSEATSNISCANVGSSNAKQIADLTAPPDAQMETATLLDLYSGCGAMSTGLCLGAALSGLNLNTKWAVDMNRYACDSLKHNHPFVKVRNAKAEDFLSLLQHWNALCKEYDVHNSNSLGSDLPRTSNHNEDGENEPLPNGTFEVERLVDICYGDPNSTGEVGLYLKVRWKTYDPSHDTWESIDGLSDSPACIKEFVESGYRDAILPLPGCVDVICGGPPCQGISGLNRFRNAEDPLVDERNKQLVVFMDIVNYLRPKYVLMENVVDILKFANGFLGRYALSRLVSVSYQARLGMMVAGCYGLPQFRMRAFLWGALPSVVLPKFPLPTHDVVKRGVVPNAFLQCLVAYHETEEKHLERALILRDAISDLPKVGNHQPNDVMEHHMRDYSLGDATRKEGQLFDHQPLRLNSDDYERVRQIPVKRGANFRDLKGVQIGENNTVEFVADIPRVLLSSGKPLVPTYAMTFMKGKSLKPFGRLWWDETVPTAVTRAEPHNQIILHPTQDRVLTIRKNARLQGFPDYYRLFGPIKQKYIQVGNAVAVPVARALGYALGKAYQGEVDGEKSLFKLPRDFIPVDQEAATRLSEATS